MTTPKNRNIGRKNRCKKAKFAKTGTFSKKPELFGNPEIFRWFRILLQMINILAKFQGFSYYTSEVIQTYIFRSKPYIFRKLDRWSQLMTHNL